VARDLRIFHHFICICESFSLLGCKRTTIF
jgi:hypothetical protein